MTAQEMEVARLGLQCEGRVGLFDELECTSSDVCTLLSERRQTVGF